MNIGSLERGWRRAWMRGIGALATGARVARAPDWDARAWSVLYLRPQGIGDLILATGVLRAIARSHPTIALDVMTAPAAVPVLDHNPHVRRIHIFDRSLGDYLALGRAVHGAGYDVVIDGKITRGAAFVKSPMLLAASSAPYRIGVGGGHHDLAYNLCVARFDRTTTHMVEGSAALAAPFGVDLARTDFRPEIFLAAAERAWASSAWTAAAAARRTDQRRWLVNLSTGRPARRWPDERWIALLLHLRARRPRATIGVIGIAAEWASVQRVAGAGGAVALPAPRLRDALALVGTSDRVLTSDTSITHAASAFTVPTVLLLERGADQWRSWNTPSEIAYWEGPTVRSLEVGTAREALDRFLAVHI
jgi:ADP-heptose:LPS heptosyltransferase